MDQLKEQLVKIKPYAFWIACSAILIGALASWYMSTGTLHQQYEEYKGKITSAISQLRAIQPKLATHPNEATNEQMAKLTRAYGEEIAKGWDLQYKRQEGVLVWPASFDQDFHEAVKNLRPIEKVPVVNTPFHLTISDSLRRRYRDFIADELPKLSTTIGGKWYVDQDPNATELRGPQRLGPDGQPMEIDRSMVLWSPENQKEILTRHFGFTAREDDPTTLEVLYAQEDLWVLQNLMAIVQKTNDGAEGRHDAAVKRIEFIRIGTMALGNAGQVMMLGSGTPTSAGTGGEGIGGYNQQPQPEQPPVDGSQPAAEPPPVSPTTDPAFLPQDPGNWRYVDQKNVPLAGFQLRAALQPQPQADPAAPTNQNVLLTVAKRMPIRLRFEIDQRRLNKLLAELGNAPLPVEVRQIRINRDPAAAGAVDSFFSAAGGMQGEGLGGGGGRNNAMPIPSGEGFGGGIRYNEGGGMQPGAGNLTKDATVDTNLIQLELYGIVYLYNPVNRSVLGLEPAGGATAMTGPPTTTPVASAGTGG